MFDFDLLLLICINFFLADPKMEDWLIAVTVCFFIVGLLIGILLAVLIYKINKKVSYQHNWIFI